MELDINSNFISTKFTKLDYSLVRNVVVIYTDIKTDIAHGQTKHFLNKLLLLVALFCFILFAFICVDDCISSGRQWDSTQYYNFSCHKIKFSVNRTFLVQNEKFCQIHNPYLLVVVPSRIESYHVRNVIRDTYGSLSRDRVSEVFGRKIDVVVRTLFVIGTNDNITTERSIVFENIKYRDILQVGLYDSYYNLTAKLLHALKWIDLYCKHVIYVLKIDEDVFVDISVLLEQLKRYTLSENGSIYGRIFDTPEHFKVYRNGKWAVKFEEYPLEKYPPYAQGTSYTITRNLVPKILETAQNLPYLPIEDVFITGIVAGKIHGAEFVKLNTTSDWGDGIPNPCKFAKNHRLAQHRMTSHLMYQTWKALMSFPITCRTYRGRRMKH